MTSSSDILKVAVVRRMARNGEARDIRIRAGLKQAELARLAKVASPTIHRWESGERCPHGPAAVRYFRALSRLQKLDGDA